MIAIKHITITMEQIRQSFTLNDTNEPDNEELFHTLVQSQIGKGRSVAFNRNDDGSITLIITTEQNTKQYKTEVKIPAAILKEGGGELIENLVAQINAQFPEKMDEDARTKQIQELHDQLEWDNGTVLTVSFNDTDEKPCHLTQYQRNYIDDALAFDYYENDILHKHFAIKTGATFTDLIKTLCFDWLKFKGRKAFRQMGQGGNWSSTPSGMWADVCFDLAVDADFKGYCPYGRVFVGVRIAYEGTSPYNNPLLRLAGKKTISKFVITQMTQMYEPHTKGQTTKLMPNYGEPYRWSVEVSFNKHLESERVKWAEEDRQKKIEEKRLAQEAFLAEQRQRDREWRARLEADLASTIVAYNAEEENLKKVIRFNRENVAAPNAKRIEAKEAERQREEAERRHAEKIAQKEAERLAKFAPKRK